MTWGARAVELILAAEPAADASQGPTVLIVLAVVTLLGTVGTAAGPVLIELVKSRGLRIKAAPSGQPVPAGETPPANPTPSMPSNPTPVSDQMVHSAQAGLSMVEAAVLDYRAQRDAAQRRYDEVLEDLSDAQGFIRDQAVYIARLEGQLGIVRQGGRHGSSPYPQQNRIAP